ncbi:MAG TPA: FtsK/SpoIIIE domain-containing protein, partial [Phycisphaerae bacterium]|nr:FtsK/SpoIIIE domain-containing protein [Phycisphaerae bacterium]
SYGQQWLTEEEEESADSTQPAPPAVEGDPRKQQDTPSFEARCEHARQQLDALEAMKLPRLTSGILPFVVVLLLTAAAAAAAQVLSASREPQFKAMGIAAALAALAATVAGIILRKTSVAQIWEVAAGLRRTLDEAARSARTAYENAAKARQARQAEAISKRDGEVHEAKTHYAPMLRKAVQTREETIGNLADEQARIRPLIEARREAGLAEVEQWRQRREAELKQGYENEIRAADERHSRQTTRIREEHDEERAALRQHWEDGLARIQAPIDENSSVGAELFPDWQSEVWNDWQPRQAFSSTIRFGEMRVDLKQITDRVPRQFELLDTFSVPALLAFPRQASLLIHADHAGRSDAIRTLQAVMVRLLTCLPPGRVRLTIIDPVGLGQNFAGFMHLADHDEALVTSRIWTSTEHIEQRLSDLTEHMETVIQKYLRNEFETIDDYNAQAGELAEPYRFLIIADFPANFSDVAVQRLKSIATSGARCGVYTLIARDTRQNLPAGTSLDELEAHSVNLIQQNGRFAWKDKVFRQFPLTLDGPPTEDFLTRILHVVGQHAKDAKRVEVPFETITPPADRIWSGTTVRDLSVPIGKMGATRLQSLRLGRGVAQHGLIAGKTGSGKSTLLHVLVTNLALWYSPDEVEFYLVDFKKGVEFKVYVTSGLPHARAIAVESDREFGLSVLQRVDSELTRRGELFRKLGVQDLAAYRKTSGQKMPRTILIIDEFQEFFSEDDKLAQDAGLLLDRLVRQGRAFGIHLLLGSQTIGGTSGLARSTIGQMAVRVALQTSEADSQIILGDGNTAARLLSRPGEAVYNDAGGLVEANSPFQVAWLSDEQREQCLARVQDRARAAGIVRPEPVVFEGNVPADLARNPLLARLIEAPAWPEPTAVPRAWIGEPVAIKEPTGVVLRRQSGSNILIIGQYDEAALAVMTAAMISLAAQHKPGSASFVVLDGSPAGSPLAGVLPKIKAALPHEVRLVEYRAAGDIVRELAEEMRRRDRGESAPDRSTCLLIYGLQRYRPLRRQEDSFSFSASGDSADKPAPDKAFADLLREGPSLGIHTIAWCDTPAAVERMLDRASLREFDHRVLFQMSASDSSNLIDSPLANKLGMNRALAYSEELGTIEKFRPYALPSDAWLAEIKNRIAGRG